MHFRRLFVDLLMTGISIEVPYSLFVGSSIYFSKMQQIRRLNDCNGHQIGISQFLET